MIKYYKESGFYKFFLNIYHYVNECFSNIRNIKYKKAVQNLLMNDNLDLKISELENNLKINQEQIYYIIRRDNPYIGLLTFVSVFLGHIAYAIEKGYIPVIDMQNYPNLYLEENEVGKKNAWELFFDQPFGVTLSDIPNNSKVIYSPKYIHPLSPFINSLYDEKESIFWKKISNKFLRFNNVTNDYYMSEYNKLIKGKKVLGLLYRGTDYIRLKPKNHPIQPSIEQYIEVIKKCVLEWGDFDCYYIATEDQEIVNELDRIFPNKILVNDRQYYNQISDIRYLAEAKFDRENDRYLKGLEYLSSIKLLSNADFIIAGLCAGTYAANFLKPSKFEKTYYFNLGVY